MSTPQQIPPAEVLRVAYGLLGDGQGAEWLENSEYTRAVVEFIGDLIGVPSDAVDIGGDDLTPFVLGMIHGAHLGTQGGQVMSSHAETGRNLRCSDFHTVNVYYKATRLDGTDFRTGMVDYASALATGEPVDVGPEGRKLAAECCTSSVLHASTVPAETLAGGQWPCRLFEVTGRPVAEEGHKRGFRSLKVVREIDATLALGPQGRELVALIERCRTLTADEVAQLYTAREAPGRAAWDATQNAAWDAARGAARETAWETAWYAAWDSTRDATQYAARDAARALVVRDLVGQGRFTQEHYDLLTGPWRRTIGPIHPDDTPLSTEKGTSR